jgi:O-antigen/teichoic acid export membrane protein
VRSILHQGTQLAGAYSLLATLGLVVLGRPLIGLFYTPDFLPSYPALVILLVGLLVANTFYWHRAALLALGYPGFPTRVNLYLALGKVLGILLLVPRFGYLMNAALLSASYVVGVSVSALKVRSIIRHRSREAGI